MNVIWVFGDAHRAQALSHRGDPNIKTPNIDSLARRGVRFDSAVAGAPWCSPFRAALLTGLYPHQCGVVQIPQRLDPTIPTITEPFRQANYHTAFVGKWHLDGFDEHTHYVPPERRGGFDYWMGYDNNNNQEECFVFGTGHETPRRLPGYETDSLTDFMLSHLERHVTAADPEATYQPFFAVLSVQPPHSPMVPPTNPPYASTVPHQSAIQFRPNVPAARQLREEAADAHVGYYGMIENLDYNVGRILTALKALGIDRETYVVYFSDHGDMLASHGISGNSLPWEECIRIPFIVGMVGGHFSMKVGTSDAPVNHVDIAPTTLGLCGIEIPQRMVGYDYSRYCIRQDRPEYRGEPDPDGEPDSAFLQQIPRKFYCPVNRAWRGVVMRDGWKYVCTPHNDWLLYDTVADPYEQANLVYWYDHQEAKERCHRRLVRWIAETGDAFEMPDIKLEGAAGCWPSE